MINLAFYRLTNAVMIRYSIPLYKLFQFFFISLKREALICGNMFRSYASSVWFLHFLHLKFFFASSESKYFVALSIHWFRSFSVEIWFSFGWIWLDFDFLCCCQIGTFSETFKDLPVHWYHLFVSIRYHKKTKKSSRNNV